MMSALGSWVPVSESSRRNSILAACAAIALSGSTRAASAPRPNIVHILADDLGWGDVGFNGQTLIKTPNVDTLAASGMRFLTAYCSAAECAPSRAALLTGFHAGHNYIDSNSDTNWRADDVTMAKTLRGVGYATAVFGKWGFGGTDVGTDAVVDSVSLPNNQGFEQFYGYLNHVRAQNYFEPALWQTNASAANGVQQVATGGAYTHDLITQKSVQYIADNAGGGSPFYLQYSPTIPHFDLDQIAQVANWDAAYQGNQYASWTDKQKKYAAMVTRLDASVGQILTTLNDPNGDGNPADSIANNTLVIFSSDNGPNFLDDAPHAFFNSNGPFKGGKIEMYEGGIRTPMVMRWPGKIASGSTSSRIIDGADFMPTMAELAGTESPVGVDGVSFAPLLTGAGGMLKSRDTFTFENHHPNAGVSGEPITKWALRQGNYKLIKLNDDTFRLYDVIADPGETTNLAAQLPSLKAHLKAAALAEGVEQPLDYAVTYRAWTGGHNAPVADDANWSGSGAPAENWSAVVQNTTSAHTRLANVNSDLTFLGFGVRGITGLQKVSVNNGATLTGRNEIRISFGGEIDLRGGTLRSNRWIDIRSGGLLAGLGTVDGGIYNASVIAASGGTLTLSGGGTHSGVLHADPNATLNLAGGTHAMTSSASLSGTGVIRIGGAAVYVASATVPSGLTFDVNAGSISATTLNSQGMVNWRGGAMNVADVQLSGAARMNVDRTGSNRTLKVSTLSIASSAKLDLADNKLIATATPLGTWNGTAYTGITGLVQRGYNSGAWNGGGIITSETTASSSVLTTLAVARAGDVNKTGTIFGGVSLNASDVLVMYTWGGDADLNGELNGDDYFAIDSHVRQSGSVFGFHKGDFNYDGAINGDDYFILDSNILFAQNYRPSPAAASAAAAVPEPSGFVALLLAASLWAKRKRPGVNRGV